LKGYNLLIAKIRDWTKKIYDRSQEWGKSPTCIRDLTIISIISCTIIPIPVEALLIAIIAASPRRWFRAVMAITIGSVIGALVCYLVGKLLLSNYIYLFAYVIPIENLENVKSSVVKEGMLYLAIASFTPGLFRIGMIAAGAISYNIVLFSISVGLGRLIRFFLEAVLLVIFGEKLSKILEKYFDIITLIMGALGLITLIIMKLIN
jgi:membrane protein YqaA with SNARE-associated domain